MHHSHLEVQISYFTSAVQYFTTTDDIDITRWHTLVPD